MWRGDPMDEKGNLCITPRGILRSFILKVLEEGPLHGYAIAQSIEGSTGFWKPSPGATYPMLSLMEGEGLLRKRKDGSRIVYSLTAKGRRMAGEAGGLGERLREKGLEVLSSMISSGDFERMGQRAVRRMFRGTPSYRAVRAANSIWVSTLRHFHSRPDSGMGSVERLLTRTDAELRRMLRGR